jgi:hypothetical protein
MIALAVRPSGDYLPMPRTARALVGGLCYHPLNRGNGRAQVFHDADDYHSFVRQDWPHQGAMQFLQSMGLRIRLLLSAFIA